jgi:hypothetical protein
MWKIHRSKALKFNESLVSDLRSFKWLDIIKRNSEVPLDASQEAGLQGNAKETEYIRVSFPE